ncbi:hypothetical protein [Thermocladium modestius]|nr:hypothetical protein [Thermocladium modestius]
MAINTQARRLQLIIYVAALITIMATLFGMDIAIVQLWLTGRSDLSIIFVALASSFTIFTDIITLIGIFQAIPLRQLHEMSLASRAFWSIIMIFAIVLSIYVPYISIRHYLVISVPIGAESFTMNGLFGLGILFYNSGLALAAYIVYLTIRRRMLPDMYQRIIDVMGPNKRFAENGGDRDEDGIEEI